MIFTQSELLFERFLKVIVFYYLNSQIIGDTCAVNAILGGVIAQEIIKVN